MQSRRTSSFVETRFPNPNPFRVHCCCRLRVWIFCRALVGVLRVSVLANRAWRLLELQCCFSSATSVGGAPFFSFFVSVIRFCQTHICGSCQHELWLTNVWPMDSGRLCFRPALPTSGKSLNWPRTMSPDFKSKPNLVLNALSMAAWRSRAWSSFIITESPISARVSSDL